MLLHTTDLVFSNARRQSACPAISMGDWRQNRLGQAEIAQPRAGLELAISQDLFCEGSLTGTGLGRSDNRLAPMTPVESFRLLRSGGCAVEAGLVDAHWQEIKQVFPKERMVTFPRDPEPKEALFRQD